MNHTLRPVYAGTRPGQARAPSSSSFLLRWCFRTTSIYMDPFIRPVRRKTIYNHDYLDCILLSKQSGEKKGSVFSPRGEKPLLSWDYGKPNSITHRALSLRALNTKGDTKSKEAWLIKTCFGPLASVRQGLFSFLFFFASMILKRTDGME